MKSGSAQRLRIGLEGLHLGLQFGQILALLLYDLGWGEGDEARVGQLGPLAFQPRLLLGRVDLTGDEDLYYFSQRIMNINSNDLLEKLKSRLEEPTTDMRILSDEVVSALYQNIQRHTSNIAPIIHKALKIQEDKLESGIQMLHDVGIKFKNTLKENQPPYLNPADSLEKMRQSGDLSRVIETSRKLYEAANQYTGESNPIIEDSGHILNLVSDLNRIYKLYLRIADDAQSNLGRARLQLKFMRAKWYTIGHVSSVLGGIIVGVPLGLAFGPLGWIGGLLTAFGSDIIVSHSIGNSIQNKDKRIHQEFARHWIERYYDFERKFIELYQKLNSLLAGNKPLASWIEEYTLT